MKTGNFERPHLAPCSILAPNYPTSKALALSVRGDARHPRGGPRDPGRPAKVKLGAAVLGGGGKSILALRGPKVPLDRASHCGCGPRAAGAGAGHGS